MTVALGVNDTEIGQMGDSPRHPYVGGLTTIQPQFGSGRSGHIDPVEAHPPGCSRRLGPQTGGW